MDGDVSTLRESSSLVPAKSKIPDFALRSFEVCDALLMPSSASTIGTKRLPLPNTIDQGVCNAPAGRHPSNGLRQTGFEIHV
ncbi:uncharacterized protein PHALS_07550 [Plasmopara halstedii]|uniref:Uncharacterized protein n=1 Tax=Plasmopara halstedii TaxID=4781 RepID=A0A0P1B4U1_PLAHL|nr:uncharacterized protein PHALS_07550 [Plasmopara halstedii]CEG49807.1 hypothetical protein PHALS_07550 [Plasmopara halstedii]|eukprot:XP_024586176.1 hypothetical protein PHALS_07550 [Plasmopara halstedii]